MCRLTRGRSTADPSRCHNGPVALRFSWFCRCFVAPVIEHLYDQGRIGSTVLELQEAVERLEIAVDAEELARVFRLRDALLAKAMAPLRSFDELELYQLSKASSTKQFLEARHRSVARRCRFVTRRRRGTTSSSIP